ncbi:hypothetical protein OEZ85_007128 [Tetradesmus obliquus]|uniref:Major facilitator superfamily (MFS) profile domain-containing protein n=1 Tax=Tetradesmus obliquus TaxID=3088 RepID=A0ABY8U0T5_TETOB|nr:hypothetical protein OEZ85_007128 [Tetradesmus obliquus]
MGSSSSSAPWAAPLPAPVKKTHKALLPLFVSLVVVTYLDRTSLAFAALQLCNTDWFNAKVYGLGSGVFYAGYVLFQIPSNLLLCRLGARLWLPLITAAFGMVAVCSALFIRGPASFYALRLALGITEAGVFPGMWHICGQFYPNTYITVPYSVIEASIAALKDVALDGLVYWVPMLVHALLDGSAVSLSVHDSSSSSSSVAADATTGPFWGWVHMAAAPGTGAVSLAAVNSVGKAGGFLGPLSFGLILHATGSYVPSILLVGAVMLCGAAMALLYTGERSGQRYQQLVDEGLLKKTRSLRPLRQQQQELAQL